MSFLRCWNEKRVSGKQKTTLLSIVVHRCRCEWWRNRKAGSEHPIPSALPWGGVGEVACLSRVYLLVLTQSRHLIFICLSCIPSAWFQPHTESWFSVKSCWVTVSLAERGGKEGPRRRWEEQCELPSTGPGTWCVPNTHNRRWAFFFHDHLRNDDHFSQGQRQEH